MSSISDDEKKQLMREQVTNKNLKELLGKKKLTEEVLMEIKTSFFCMPCVESDEKGLYCLHYADYKDGEVFHLFTSYEEFLKTYKDEKEIEEIYLHLNEFETEFYANTLGVIINPSSDNIFIPASVVFHIINDINRNNEEYDLNYQISNSFNNNSILHKYCRGKKNIRMYSSLFDYLNVSTLYTAICFDENMDEYLKDGELTLNDVDYSIYKRDNYYVLFSEVNLLKEEIKNIDGNFYYIIADARHIAKLTLEFDYEGIILKTPEDEIILPRKNLLKQFKTIINRYSKRKNSHETAYKLED